MADDTRQPKTRPLPEGERTSLPSWATLDPTAAPPAKQPPYDAREAAKRSTAETLSGPSAASKPSPVKREIVNEMPGGTANTAGGEKIVDYSFWGILTSIRPNEFLHLHRLPCVRDALLTGIGCGFGAGGLAFVAGRAVWTACNWSIFSFLGSSIGMHEYCRQNLAREKAGMRRAIEVMDAKRMEKDKKMEETREKRRRERREREEAEEKARLEEERKRKQWYRFW